MYFSGSLFALAVSSVAMVSASGNINLRGDAAIEQPIEQRQLSPRGEYLPVLPAYVENQCQYLKAALIWIEQDEDSTPPEWDFERYNDQIVKDMDVMFDTWTGYSLADADDAPTLDDLMSADVIIVNGEGPAYLEMTLWLDGSGSDMLQTLSDAGKGVFVSAGGWKKDEVSLFGGSIVLNGDFVAKRAVLPPGSPIAAGPFLPLCDGGAMFSWTHVGRSKIDSYPGDFSVLVEDPVTGSPIAVGGINPISGASIIVSGATHPNLNKCESPSRSRLGTQEVLNVNFNMFQFVCPVIYT